MLKLLNNMLSIIEVRSKITGYVFSLSIIIGTN